MSNNFEVEVQLTVALWFLAIPSGQLKILKLKIPGKAFAGQAGGNWPEGDRGSRATQLRPQPRADLGKSAEGRRPQQAPGESIVEEGAFQDKLIQSTQKFTNRLPSIMKNILTQMTNLCEYFVFIHFWFSIMYHVYMWIFRFWFHNLYHHLYI